MLTANNPAVREYLTVMESRDGNVKVDISEISDIRICLNIIWIYVSVFEFNVVAKLIHPNPLRDIQIRIRFHLKTI